MKEIKNQSFSVKSQRFSGEREQGDKLYYNGTIVTMEEEQRYAEAVLTRNGRIVAAGGRKKLEGMAGKDCLAVDLAGNTLLPAFIDPHSHFTSAANTFLEVSLKGCRDFEEITERIQRYIEENRVEKGSFVKAGGYDHNMLREGRHPTAEVLDRAARENPLVIQHTSGHMGVLNTAALERLKIPAIEDAIPGGRIAVKDGRSTGYLEENAMVETIKRIPMADAGSFMGAYEKAQEWYASQGIATVQEGMFSARLIPLYQEMEKQGNIRLDVVGYPDFPSMERVRSAFPAARGGYDRGFKIGGYKIFLDGSPQGRTAWMRTPYAGTADCGYGTMKEEEVLSCVCRVAEEGVQLLAHCNGDAACEQYIRAVERAEAQGYDVKGIRPVMIHAQLLGTDQLERVKRCGIIPSFFIAHVYHWGDTHRKNFGEERAAKISPAGSALSRGMRFTFHQDTPVVAPDMLETVWCAVCRRTAEGVTLGREERIPVWEALKAVTVNAAWQYFEEKEKGSIAAGKRADFVVLDRNPLETEPEELRGIRVLATVKDGETLYVRGL